MASLQEVIDQLKENNEGQKETTKLLDNWITEQKRGAGRRLEDRIEGARKAKGFGNIPALDQMAQDTSSLGLPILTPITIAFMAWVADLDAYLRALRPDILLKPIVTFFNGVKNTFGRFTTFIDEISKIRLPDISIKIPEIRFLSDAGEAITDFIDYKIRLPIINFIDDAGKAITDFIDYKIKLPALNFVDDAGKVIGEFIDLKMPEGVKTFFNKSISFFDDIKTFGASIIDKLIVPEGVQNFFTKTTKFFTDIADWFRGIEASIDLSPFLDPIKKALGFADEAGTAGSGLLGFFGKVKGFLGVILKPVGIVTRILGGPFVQGFLTFLDFFKGFKDAFSLGEVKYDEFGNVLEDDRGLTKRLFDGIYGGISEVIGGLADAFDILFLKIPGWILGWLGFDNVSKFLKDINVREMIQPVLDWIKNIPTMVMDLIPSAEELKQMTINMIAAIPGGYYILKAMGAAGPALELARTNAAIEEAQAAILSNQSDIDRSLAGENVYVGGLFGDGEESGRARSGRRIAELRAEIAELEEQRAAQQAAIVINAPQTNTTNTSSTGVNLAPRLSASDVQRMSREGLLPRGGR